MTEIRKINFEICISYLKWKVLQLLKDMGEICMVEFRLSFALIITLLLINFFPKTNRMEINSYDSEKRNEINPLYKKRERFRKNRNHKRGSIFTAELKLDYYCQVIAVIQIILLSVFSLYSDNVISKIEIILFGWCVLHIFITILVGVYYDMIFGSAYKRTPWTDWNPFEYTGNVRTVPLRKISPFKGIDEINEHISSVGQELGYQIVHLKKIAEEKKICFWVKREKHCIKIFETIRLTTLENEDIKVLNEIFEKVLEQVLKGEKQSIRVYFTFFFVVDEETRAFRNIINKEVIQGIRRYRLPAGMTMDDGMIQIASIENDYKSRKAKKMYQELYDILGL